MNVLFLNKSLKCFNSIFEKKYKFKNIVRLANKYWFLFSSKTLDKNNNNERIKSDYIFLKEEFFYGKYKKKKDSKLHQVKQPIWEEMYWYFLIMSNFINKNKEITSLNDGKHRYILNCCFQYCYINILLILRTIFNKKNFRNDDINIWNLQTLKNKNSKYVKWLNSLYKQSNFEKFIKFMNKRHFHITSKYKKSFRLNSAFNIFESLYIISKIIFWENRPRNAKYWTYNIHYDAESYNRYDGDLLNIDKLKCSEELWWKWYEKNS